MIEKIMKIIDSLPEDQKSIIVSKYSTSNITRSPKVEKLIKIYDSLMDEEKKSFKDYCMQGCEVECEM